MRGDREGGMQNQGAPVKYGYARTSSEDQSNSIETQNAALLAAGCDVVRHEQVSGASIEGRRELQTLLEFMRADDVLIVTKLDRLARNTVDMLTLIQQLGERGIGFRSSAEPWADTTSPAGKLMLTVMAGVAEFERARIKERQREGIDRARAEGRYVGGKVQYDRGRVWELLDAGTSKAEIARQMGCTEMTVYRIVNDGRPQPEAKGA